MGNVVGHRSLLAPHEWPGCTLGFEIVGDGGSGPALRISVRFDRRSVRVSKHAIVAAWSSIRRHANDPSLEFAVICSLQGGGTVGDAVGAVRRYRALVERLFRGVAGGGDAPVTAVMILALNPDTIAPQTETLSPLSVDLTLTRRLSAAKRDKPEIRERVRSRLSPWLPRSVRRPAVPFSWARRAEAALVGYDGPGSRIMLARPARKAETSARLWTLRWGGGRGVALGRDGVPPVVFVARPFAIDLLRGEIDATVWNDALEPEEVRRAYSGIDVDAVFGRVVAILDRLLAPDRVVALGRADPDAPVRIRAARQAATRTFARQLIPAVDGPHDARAAIDVSESMEQAASLGIADTGSRWVRYQFAASESAVRLRLDGVISGVPSLSGGDCFPVDVLHGTGAATRLDFPVCPRPDADRATLSLRPLWTLTGIERLDDDAGDARLVGRLIPVLPAARDGKVDIALGAVDVPLTSPIYPEPVGLVEQEAIGPDEPSGQALVDLMAETTRWSFAFKIARGALHPRDDIWLKLEFNRPSARPSAAPAGTSALTALAASLLRFEAGYDSLAPLLAESVADAVPIDALGSIVTRLTDDLIEALAAPSTDAATQPAMEEGDVWVWRDHPNPDGGRSLFVRANPTDAGGPQRFPMIGGCPPQDREPPPSDRAPDAGEWREAVYYLPDDAGSAPLPFVLDGLDLLSHQAVAVDARVARDMGSGLDPRLARTTEWAALGPVVIPANDLSMPLAAPPDVASLERSLAIALDPFCKVGDRIGGKRTLRIELVYRHPLEMHDGEAGPIVSVPILATSLSPDVDTRPAEIAAALAARCRAWAETVTSERERGWVSLAAVLTIDLAGTSVPLLAVRQLDLPGL